LVLGDPYKAKARANRQAAMEQQPNYDDFSDEELESFTKILEVVPSIMPLITLAVCLQSVAYISYGLAVVRNYSR
jgi:hypothetical protein